MRGDEQVNLLSPTTGTEGGTTQRPRGNTPPQQAAHHRVPAACITTDAPKAKSTHRHNHKGLQPCVSWDGLHSRMPRTQGGQGCQGRCLINRPAGL